MHSALGFEAPWAQTWLVVVALACSPRIQEVDIGGPGVQGQFGLEEALFQSQNKQNHKFTSMFYQEKYGMRREKNAITKFQNSKASRMFFRLLSLSPSFIDEQKVYVITHWCIYTWVSVGMGIYAHIYTHTYICIYTYIIIFMGGGLVIFSI